MTTVNDLRDAVRHLGALLTVTACEADCAHNGTDPCRWCQAADWHDEMRDALDGPETAPPGGGIRHPIRSIR